MIFGEIKHLISMLIILFTLKIANYTEMIDLKSNSSFQDYFVVLECRKIAS